VGASVLNWHDLFYFIYLTMEKHFSAYQKLMKCSERPMAGQVNH